MSITKAFVQLNIKNRKIVEIFNLAQLKGDKWSLVSRISPRHNARQFLSILLFLFFLTYELTIFFSAVPFKTVHDLKAAIMMEMTVKQICECLFDVIRSRFMF